MSRVLIIGGHGKVALRLAPLLVERGDDVTSVIRNAEHEADVAATGAAPKVADVEKLDRSQLAELIAGHDAVVWTAGAGGGNPERTYAVDRDAAIRSMDAASDAGASRYVMVSFLRSGPDHGLTEADALFHYAEAKAAADEHLRGTGLDWTVLGPGPLTLDDPTGLIETREPGRGEVTRADVAAVIAQTLSDSSTIRRTIPFGNGTVPIAEALAD